MAIRVMHSHQSMDDMICSVTDKLNAGAAN